MNIKASTEREMCSSSDFKAMNPNKVGEKTIVQIFKDMDYENKPLNNDLVDTDVANVTLTGNAIDIFSELHQVLKITKEPKSFDSAVEAALKAQNKWKNSAVLKRGNSLHRIWRQMKEISKSLLKSKKQFMTLIDYFDFYSDLAIQTEEYKSWRPYGVVMIVLLKNSCALVLGATVAAALSSGCSVVVLANEAALNISLFLEEIISENGLPEGVYNTVFDFENTEIPVTKKINKVFFYGNFLSAQKMYTKSLAKSFNFFCPNNTAALILESCDLNAAVNKIVSETWGKDSLFAVSHVVVLESIQKAFLEKLKNKMEQFISENKDFIKFKDKVLSEKIKKVISEALKSGALVEQSSERENEWSPTVLVNYQNQDIDEDLPVVIIECCRTGKEGVTILNNCKFNLGVSVWTEIASQALEISSLLISPNVWINCHGVSDAGQPLQLSGLSGNCVLGGSDGMIEYISFRSDDPVEGNKSLEDKISKFENLKLIQISAAAYQAFTIWQNLNNRRKYIKDIASSLEDNKEFSKLSEMICTFAHFGSIVNFSERNLTQEVLVVKKKVPIGVILLIVNSSNIDVKILTSLIIPSMVLGNAVIVVLREENTSVKTLIKNFNIILPKNLLSLVTGIKAGFYLASDPNIQAIWLCDEPAVSTEFLQTIKGHSEKTMKYIWIIPKNITVSQHLFQKKCLKNKITWLTKIDHFP